MSIADTPRLLAVTQGDPSGIGPDITLLAWRAMHVSGPPFAVIGDAALYRARSAQLSLSIPIRETDFGSASAVFPEALPVIDTGRPARGKPGRPETTDAVGTLASIASAADAIRAGSAAAMVTNPIAKHVLYAAGFAHPGHTEYLGELAQTLWGIQSAPVMLLWSPTLAVVPVTIHVALSAVPSLLTRDLLLATARTVHREMQARFGLHKPRLAVAGLNPHAGEDGSMGREEIETIAPAIEQLRFEGLDVVGPFSADTMFHPAARARYDVALTMYHDQGLIPIKTLSFDTGVNVTLGLPFVRTSPDHGTAFTLAGSGAAKPDSLLAALELAARLTKPSPSQLSP